MVHRCDDAKENNVLGKCFFCFFTGILRDKTMDITLGQWGGGGVKVVHRCDDAKENNVLSKFFVFSNILIIK